MNTGPWIYTDVSGVEGRAVGIEVRQKRECLYCEYNLEDLGTVTRRMEYVLSITDYDRELARRAGSPIPDELTDRVEEGEEEVDILRCPQCGWWIAWSPYLNTGGHIMEEVGYGILRALDPLDIGEPVEAIRSYLTLKYKDRNKVHPRKFEEVVCSIFQDLGYSARTTSYSGDGGIDVYLDGPDNALIGVQVKRYGKPIEIEQINALTGAMVVKGCSKGIFVTTSRYRKGAVQTAKISGQRGYPIELYDADRLLDILRVAQANVRVDPHDPVAPWMRCPLPTYYKVQ